MGDEAVGAVALEPSHNGIMDSRLRGNHVQDLNHTKRSNQSTKKMTESINKEEEVEKEAREEPAQRSSTRASWATRGQCGPNRSPRATRKSS